MVGIESQHLLQMKLALRLESRFFAALGRIPVPGDGIGHARQKGLVTPLRLRFDDDPLDLRIAQGHMAAEGRLEQIGFRRGD